MNSPNAYRYRIMLYSVYACCTTLKHYLIRLETQKHTPHYYLYDCGCSIISIINLALKREQCLLQLYIVRTCFVKISRYKTRFTEILLSLYTLYSIVYNTIIVIEISGEIFNLQFVGKLIKLINRNN